MRTEKEIKELINTLYTIRDSMLQQRAHYRYAIPLVEAQLCALLENMTIGDAITEWGNDDIHYTPQVLAAIDIVCWRDLDDNEPILERWIGLLNRQRDSVTLDAET